MYFIELHCLQLFFIFIIFFAIYLEYVLARNVIKLEEFFVGNSDFTTRHDSQRADLLQQSSDVLDNRKKDWSQHYGLFLA